MAHFGRAQRRPYSWPEIGHSANIAAQHARTFGDGLRHLVRYSTILCWFDHMRIVKSENECIIEFTGPLRNGAAPTILPEHAFARALEIGRRGTQRPLYPLRVELTRTASHQEIYEAHYGCRVRFRARYNAIVFRAGDLVGQSGTTEGSQIQRNCDGPYDVRCRAYSTCRFQLKSVPLAIIKAERINRRELLGAGDGQAGRAVQTAAEQNNGRM